MNNKEIIDQSLIESSSFSSNVHAIEKVALADHVIAGDFPIPDRYYRSKVVLLPVNVKRFYVYWELSDELLESLNLKTRDIRFQIVDQNSNNLFEFACEYPIGEYFINKEFESFSVQAIAGYYNEKGEFINILEPSNIINIFDKKIKLAKDQKEVWIKKEKGMTEVIRASLQHFTVGMSSASYVEEIERLKQYEQEMLESMSSKDIVEGK
jgi:hypothetical protein